MDTRGAHWAPLRHKGVVNGHPVETCRVLFGPCKTCHFVSVFAHDFVSDTFSGSRLEGSVSRVHLRHERWLLARHTCAPIRAFFVTGPRGFKRWCLEGVSVIFPFY